MLRSHHTVVRAFFCSWVCSVLVSSVAHGQQALDASVAVSEDAGATGGIDATCSVALERIAFDDPGVDDAEWIQLRIEGKTAQQLGDCGFGILELLTDGTPSCSPYHTLDLRHVGIPKDGNVVLCAASSAIFASYGCDVTESQGRQLENGWLQNGPDAIRWRDEQGNSAWEVAYGGAACGAQVTIENSGASASTKEVHARCPGGFQRLPLEQAPPRAQAQCNTEAPAPSRPNSSLNDAGTSGEAIAPSTPRNGDVFDAGFRVAGESVTVDARASESREEQSMEAQATSPPPELGCRFKPHAARPQLTWLLALFTAGYIRRRR